VSALGFFLVLVTLIACMSFIVWRAKQQLTLFVLRVEQGRIAAVKGRMPRRLLSDIGDAVRQEHRLDLQISCRIEDGAAQLHVYGDTNPGFEQLLRNLVGEYPLPRLKQAPRARI
jgi:hypothetical protein